MRFKIDENLPLEAALVLRQTGHDASTVNEQGMSGCEDKSIAAVCREEQRVLVTLDLDFAGIRAHPPALHEGLIVMRVKRQDKWTVISLVERVVEAKEQEPLVNKSWIVDEERIRIRE